jgi:hypothetical protein
MSTVQYARRHKLLGLCRSCPTPVAIGSTTYCEYHRNKDRIRGRRVSKISIIKLREECLNHYGKTCNCCGEKIIQFLTLDHVGGNGNIQRKKLFGYNISGVHMYRWLKKNNFPDNFRILCMNCNWATRYRKACPHTLER